MKIRESLNNPAGVIGTTGKDERKVSDSMGSGFQSQLKRVENRNHEDRLNEMVGNIIRQGEKLAEKIDIRELKIYKRLIAEFLDEAVSNAHKFSKQNFLDRRGRHRVYAVVKKINNELDLLAQDILNEERDNIGILQRLDDIRGLVLDIIM